MLIYSVLLIVSHFYFSIITISFGSNSTYFLSSYVTVTFRRAVRPFMFKITSINESASTENCLETQMSVYTLKFLFFIF